MDKEQYIQLKGVINEDFVNYKKISMTLEFPTCSFKCDKECGQPLCQNWSLTQQPTQKYSIEGLVQLYLNNPITEAIVCQGLEPLDSWGELMSFIYCLRVEHKCNDDIVIYTGYKEDEPQTQAIQALKGYNLIVKYGRYIPGQERHLDPVLGVQLASNNQYAKEIT